MDVTFSNVLEGTRQYFLGLPKQVEGNSASPWPSGVGDLGDNATSVSTSSASTPTALAQPPRPLSEPLEPEPHIIHKATVMREAAEKRREQPDPEDDEEARTALSPPSHIIQRPAPPPAARAPPSPAAAPAAPSPSPARPPSAAPPLDSRDSRDSPQPRPPSLRLQSPASRPPDNFAQARPPDPYSVSRPPETYSRYHYENSLPDTGRTSLGPLVPSPQPSLPPRHSPQTYARLSNSVPQHTSRLREMAAHSPPTQRFVMPTAQPVPPHNDRVPPIHHPSSSSVPPQRSLPMVDTRAGSYPTLPQHREPSPYSRVPTHYDRHSQLPQRKYDPQHTYPGYRPSPPAPQPVQPLRVEPHHHVQYKLTHADTINSHYPTRPVERGLVQPSQSYSSEISRHQQHELARRTEYPPMNRSIDSLSNHHYSTSTSSTATSRYPPSAPSTVVPVVPSSALPPRTIQRSATAPKSSYEYPTSTHVQTSPARSANKPGYPNQQARMTVSVTTLVNQMNQTKQKRESPLDLSVKTVKNSADSSTTQDDAVDSATPEAKPIPLQPRPTSTTRQAPVPANFVESHKVDFAPDFSRYRERTTSSSSQQVVSTYPTPPQSAQHPVRYNGAYEAPSQPPSESYPIESRHQVHSDRNKYTVNSTRPEYVPRIDLTRSVPGECRQETRLRDDRHYVIEERKRPAGPIVSNIPEKMVRYETWTADSRIAERMSQSAREQHELMSRPVYSYSSHKQFEAYQNEQKRIASASVYRDHHQHPHTNHRYPGYPAEGPPTKERVEYYPHHQERRSSINNRHVIQKMPSHRDLHAHSLDPNNSVPADKRVLSILRNSLETRQTGFVEPAKPARQIPDLIVIDDVDDSVIEITDLTKENEVDSNAKVIHKMRNSYAVQNIGNHIQMPKAVDSIPQEYPRIENIDPKSKFLETDVYSRIRTKAELKVLPPSQETKPELNHSTTPENEKLKLLPKSQKQHIFNQIRKDSKLDSVIKTEISPEKISEVKTEPINFDEVENDAKIIIKTENSFGEFETTNNCDMPEDDLGWASACDSFMEQLKTSAHKKKSHRKKTEPTEEDHEKRRDSKFDPLEIEKESQNNNITRKENLVETTPVVIKQEPLDNDEIEKKIVSIESEIKQLQSQIKSDTLKKMSSPDVGSDDEKLIKPLKSQNLESQSNQSPDKKCKSSLEKDKTKKRKPSVASESADTRKIRKSKIADVGEDKEDLKRVKKALFKNESKEIDKDQLKPKKCTVQENKPKEKTKRSKLDKNDKVTEKASKDKLPSKIKIKQEKLDTPSSTTTNQTSQEPIKTVIKEEVESTDDDEPLIKSKLQKEKEMKFQLLKDLSEKSAYVKLECFDVDMNKNTRISIDSINKDKDEKPNKLGKITRQSSRTKGKSLESKKVVTETTDSTSDSDDDDVTVASRLRLRKNIKTEDKTNTSVNKTPVKASSSKKQENSISIVSSTPLSVRKPGFGDGSDFHPGWEEELYKYKRSLRMPTRLIAIPRGRSGGPFVRGSSGLFKRGSTSLPDLDPAPLSPAPSSAPSAATDADIYIRRPDKLILDSDLDSNSSYSAPHRLHYDSEASTSTVFSLSAKKKTSSIVDVLIQKCGKRDESKKKNKDKEDKLPKVIPKNSNELLPTPSLGLVKNGNKGLNAKKEKLMEDIFYLGAFRKETVSAFRNAFINNTDGLIGATEEFAPVVLKTRTRTESRVLKQRATIKEVFGDERPASAPPACREDDDEDIQDPDNIPVIKIKIEPKEQETKPKLKPKKIIKDKLLRRSSTIRDGLRSTMSLKRNDAKGRLMRLKKRNSLMKSLANKRMRDIAGNKIRREKSESSPENKEKPKEPGTEEITEGNSKRRLKRLFGRRKFSSGFDYIRKKKKIIRKEGMPNKIRRPAIKPSPESVHDIHKEIKGWFINKSIGETHLHRAARLGYVDCVAYCLEKMEAEASARDNAGYTPLHFAASKGHVKIGRLLLLYGANVSAAAQGGVRPLHEACENNHMEMIRLLLSYGADPLLGTYAGQTPEQLAEGQAARMLTLHIADVQGLVTEPWRFPPPGYIIDCDELGCEPLSSPPPASPPPPPDTMIEIQCTEAPLPPFYSLKAAPGQPSDGLWCLLQDVTNLLQIKSKESLLKQIHCGSGSPKELLREIRTQEFLERAQCHQLLGAGEKVNVRASKVSLVRVTDKLRQLLKIETVLVS